MIAGGNMNTSSVLRAYPLALGLVCMSARAEWRCDCTTIVDTCTASVTVEADAVSIESDHGQCSRVDYMIDGLPFVALVVEGSERQSWLSRSENPKVLMQSCQVCLDNADAPVPLATPRAPVATPQGLSVASEPSREGKLSPLLAVDPQYPRSAAASRTEGFVEVTFTVTALGQVENARVRGAQPPGRSLLRWDCQSTETAKSLLVRPGDRLAGNVAMIDIPDGKRTFTYAENLSVARYPNSEYWWLACGVDDSECRGSGRQWARSMGGKDSTVDPQLWTAQSLARSD